MKIKAITQLFGNKEEFFVPMNASNLTLEYVGKAERVNSDGTKSFEDVIRVTWTERIE